MEKPLIIGIVIAVVVAIPLILFATHIINPINRSCNVDADCEMAFVALEACGSCDSSSPKDQCVNINEANDINQRWNLLVLKRFCMTCPSEPIMNRCVCNQGMCGKTTACTSDADCANSPSGDYYVCVEGQCKLK